MNQLGKVWLLSPRMPLAKYNIKRLFAEREKMKQSSVYRATLGDEMYVDSDRE